MLICGEGQLSLLNISGESHHAKLTAQKCRQRSQNSEEEREAREVRPSVRARAGSAYLGGDVVGGAAEGVRGVALQHPLPAHAEVSDFNVTLAVKQHVVQL